MDEETEKVKRFVPLCGSIPPSIMLKKGVNWPVNTWDRSAFDYFCSNCGRPVTYVDSNVPSTYFCDLCRGEFTPKSGTLTGELSRYDTL